MNRNSAIKQRTGICPLCSDGKEKPLTKGMCGNHYWSSIRMKSIAKQQEREVIKEGLSDVIADLDAIYSRWLRLSAADKEGNCICYTCDAKIRWQDAQCSHFISRGHLYLRWDSRNTVVACSNCNIGLHGNIPEYSKRLELQYPGLVQILQEESRIIFKPTVSELKERISELTQKIKKLK